MPRLNSHLTQDGPENKKAQRKKELEALFGFRFISVKELGDIIHIHRTSIVRDIIDGKLLAYRLGKQWQIKEIDAWNYIQCAFKFRPDGAILRPEPDRKHLQPPTQVEDLTFLTLEDMMLLFQVTRETIIKEMESGRLPGYKMNREYRFEVYEVFQYIQTLNVKPGQYQLEAGEESEEEAMRDE